MFKVLALAGLVAGGAVYGLYEYTDLFCCHSDSQQACCQKLTAKKSCCDGTTPDQPSCCTSGDECCDVNALCCITGTAAIASKTKSSCDNVSPCCTASAAAVAKKATCCATPCAACVAAGSTSSDLSAKAAVGGVAVFTSTPQK